MDSTDNSADTEISISKTDVTMTEIKSDGDGNDSQSTQTSHTQITDDTVFEEPHWLNIVDLYIWRIKIIAIIILYAIEPWEHSVLAGFMYFVSIILMLIILYFFYWRKFGKKYFIATCRMFVIGVFSTELYHSDRGFIKTWEDAVHDAMGIGFFITIVIICIICTIFIGFYSWKATRSVSQTIQKTFGIYSTPFNTHYAESDKVIKIDLDCHEYQIKDLSLEKIKSEHASLRNESIIGINGKLCFSVFELQQQWDEIDKIKRKSVYFIVSKSDNEGNCMRNWLLLILWMFRFWFVVYMIGVLHTYITDRGLDMDSSDEEELRDKYYGSINTFDSAGIAMLQSIGYSFCEQSCIFLIAATYFMMPEFKKVQQAPFVFIFWAAFTFSFVQDMNFFRQQFNVGVLFFRVIFGTSWNLLFSSVSCFALINGLYGDPLQFGTSMYLIAFCAGVCWEALNRFLFLYEGVYDIHDNAPFVLVTSFLPLSILIVAGIWMKVFQRKTGKEMTKYIGYSSIGVLVWTGLMIILWIVIIPEKS